MRDATSRGSPERGAAAGASARPRDLRLLVAVHRRGEHSSQCVSQFGARCLAREAAADAREVARSPPAAREEPARAAPRLRLATAAAPTIGPSTRAHRQHRVRTAVDTRACPPRADCLVVDYSILAIHPAIAGPSLSILCHGALKGHATARSTDPPRGALRLRLHASVGAAGGFASRSECRDSRIRERRRNVRRVSAPQAAGRRSYGARAPRAYRCWMVSVFSVSHGAFPAIARCCQ